MTTAIAEILEGFEFLEDWEDRYRYVIELGRELEPLSDDERSEENRVHGCVSQVWLSKRIQEDGDNGPILFYKGDSDAHIVRGLVAIVLAQYSGVPAKEILETDIENVFSKIGLKEHLTPQRSNGLSSMVQRIKDDASAALALN
ncbi:Fe-S metabolism associated SufE [Pseudovibrio sp. FO-BEG1]|uniref:Cysteine desulfuration protein SufE n=3 Tax=Pseudovibrio TaxID=258255 RepID=A0A1I6YE74_9HYPH|nr:MULTISPECIES: SufE family protein [Pseudovibrio]AEV36954.1 Fe-S metabolism associated SufE [Pseudovibrio sp. FO-BEG1]QUS57228.1 SufE family protein [Pseudovibrio brasiliensis]SFT48836.1 Cysteine desulfuration protein SufE [Pseudovibrio denitrificans]